ncbi:hypothetical protein LSAT2_024590, partial [Lamellibrachia satsuma]
MEKGPKRKHDKKTKSSSNCDPPPGSADHEPIGEEPEAQNATSPPQLAGPSQPRRLSGRKKEARNRSKLYREKELLKIRLRQQHRLTERYRKRITGIIGKQRVSTAIRRSLLFSRVIIDATRNRYKQLKSRNDRIVVTKIVASRLLKKYRLRCHAQREFGFHRQSNRFLLEDVTSIKHKRQMRPVNRMKEAITEFYCRDDNSRLTTGRKQTRTKEKRK